MASPFRRIGALTLLVALLPLVACAAEPDTGASEPGDVVAARAGVDTEGAPETFLMFPSGRLDVRAGEPVESIPAEDTAERQARQAPDGGSFVPLTWSYQTAPMEKFRAIFGLPRTIEMSLISGGVNYKLAPPTVGRDGQEAVAFYVAVDGTGEDAKLEVQYDRQRQKIDLRTGTRSAKLAKPLYDLVGDSYSNKQKACPNERWVDEGPLVQANFTCTTTDVVVVPYVDGEWAPEGKSFAVIGLTTALRAVTIYGGPGAAAIYSVVSSKDKTELAGERPTKVIAEQSAGGADNTILVFTIEGDPPDELDFQRTYTLLRSVKQGAVDAPSERKIDLQGTIPVG